MEARPSTGYDRRVVTFQLEDTFALLERTPGALREQLVGS